MSERDEREGQWAKRAERAHTKREHKALGEKMRCKEEEEECSQRYKIYRGEPIRRAKV